MLEHHKHYSLNNGTLPVGVDIIVKAIPSMPGFLAIAYFNKLIIYSLEMYGVNLENFQATCAAEIISLDVSEVLISGKTHIFILLGFDGGVCSAFEILGNELNFLFETSLDAKNKIISMRVVNFKGENRLLVLSRGDRRTYAMDTFSFNSTGSGGKPHFVFDYEHYFNDFKAVANANTIDIYLLNPAGKSRFQASSIDNFCNPICHYSLDNLFQHTLKSELSSRGEVPREGPVIRISSDFMVEAEKPLFFSVGPTNFSVGKYSFSVGLPSFTPVPFPPTPWIHSYFNPLPKRNSLFFPKIISKTQTIIIELPFVFVDYEQKCNYFIIHLKDGESSTRQIFAGALTRELFMPNEERYFFYDIIVQEGKPFILLGDTRQGILCLDISELKSIYKGPRWCEKCKKFFDDCDCWS